MAGSTGAVGGPSPIGVESSIKATYEAAGVKYAPMVTGTRETQQRIEQQQSGEGDAPKKPNQFAFTRAGSQSKSSANKDDSSKA